MLIWVGARWRTRRCRDRDEGDFEELPANNYLQVDKLIISQTGFLAQRRLARGVRLNHGEAVALIANVLHELIRDGDKSVADLMSLGSTLLGRRHVLPSVPHTLTELQVEGTFRMGSYLVTVHNPIASDDGDLERALYGSFLPVPEKEAHLLGIL